MHYVVADALGTPRELLTEQGKVAWANRLSTWGQANVWPLAASNDDILSCNLRFAGQYADDESGLHYNRFRYYDNETGQYLTPDPLKLLGGVNLYGYVHNPVGYIDPLGLACCTVVKQRVLDNIAASKAAREASNFGSPHPVPGSRTKEGFMNAHVSPDRETLLFTNLPGFNNNNGKVGGQFKRFGLDSHAGVSPHVHQPTRNISPKDGSIYGGQGTKTSNGGVTAPTNKDIKQLYDNFYNGKYNP